MTTFRRLTVPPTTGYISPAGYSWPYPGYAYINNDPVGGDQAPAATTGSAANNAGTFFVAFQDDASTANANRPHDALAKNTDLLDDTVHRPFAHMNKKVEVAAPNSVNIVVSTGLVWCGDSTDADPSDFVWIEQRGVVGDVDVTGWEVTRVAGGGAVRNKCVDIRQEGVSVLGGGVHDAAVSPITFVFEASVTANVHLYYATLGCVALSTPGVGVRHLGQSTPMSAAVRQSLDRIRGDGGNPWTDPPVSLQGASDAIESLWQRGADDTYRRQVGDGTSAVPEAYYPAVSAHAAGSGGWIRRDGIAPAVFSQRTEGQISLDPINGCHKVFLQDSVSGLYAGGSVGYVAYGARRHSDVADVEYAPGFATFLALQQHHVVDGAGDHMTVIPKDTAAVIAGGVVTLTVASSVARFSTDVGGFLSAVSVGVDLLEFQNAADGKVWTFVIQSVSHASTQQCTVLALNGDTPSLAATGTVRYRPAVFQVADGSYQQGAFGFFYSAGAPNTDSSWAEGKPVGFFAGSASAAVPALQWGRHTHVVSSSEQPGYEVLGTLDSDGNISAADCALSGDLVVAGTTTLVQPSVFVDTVASTSYSVNATNVRFITLDDPQHGLGPEENGANPLAITLQQLRSGMDITIAIVRSSDAFDSITIAATVALPLIGAMPVSFNETDKALTPWVSGTVYDVYRVCVLGTRAYVTVQRY